jgi:lipid A 4'-phosphatase
MEPNKVAPAEMTEPTVPRHDDPKCYLGRVLSSVVRTPAIWVPVVVLVAATVVFRFTDADLAFSSLFFTGHDSSSKLESDWPNRTAQLVKLLYDFGIYPAWALGIGGLVAWVMSFFWIRLRSWRDPGLFFALMLALGPGLIVNGLFKPYWGRPRPHSTISFGGEQEFLPVFQKGYAQESYSFPCGHASAGFYLMAPAFVCYRRRPRLAAAFLILGLFAGFSIGMARIMQGSHFASDVIWSGGFVYFTGLVLSVIFRFNDGNLPTSSKATA